MSQISKEIFDKIRTRFSNVQLGDAEGKTTLDSDQAVFFEFPHDGGLADIQELGHFAG